MKHRILATAALWLLVIALPLLLGRWGAFILIAAFGTGAMVELLSLLRQAGHTPDRTISLAGFVLILLGLVLCPPWVFPPLALILGGLCLVVTACLFLSGIGSFGKLCLPSLGALALMLLPFAPAILLIHEDGMLLLVWALAVAKFGDVGALLTGMWIGRHRMAPVLSPKKTWEGLGGGIVLSVLVSVGFAVFAKEWLPEALSPALAALAAIPISLAGVIGDLIESALKREAKVKDSGGAIPGIGGFLDLTDSLILAFPVAYCIIWIIT
jgi:phosphatidate cytidylyltransferase